MATPPIGGTGSAPLDPTDFNHDARNAAARRSGVSKRAVPKPKARNRAEDNTVNFLHASVNQGSPREFRLYG